MYVARVRNGFVPASRRQVSQQGHVYAPTRNAGPPGGSTRESERGLSLQSATRGVCMVAVMHGFVSSGRSPKPALQASRGGGSVSILGAACCFHFGGVLFRGRKP